MKPMDIKKKLFTDMAGAADEMELDDLRQRYGPKPKPMMAPASEPMAELTDEELEPLLTISISAGQGAAEVEDEEPPLDAA